MVSSSSLKKEKSLSEVFVSRLLVKPEVAADGERLLLDLGLELDLWLDLGLTRAS